MKIDISVIVPVYNMEDKIDRCLDSLVSQTKKNIEIIVIDDGSVDNSLAVIRKYEKKYKNIIVISRENKGISATRNEGIKIAKGKYIGFVDSDDYVEIDMYEKLYNSIIINDSDIAICNYKTFNSNNVFINNDIDKQCEILNLHDNPSMIYKIDFAPWNKLYKKDIWNNIEFPLNTKYEDLEAVMKVFLNTKKIVYIRDYLYNYYVNNTGETLTINDKVFDIYKVLNSLKKEFSKYSKVMMSAYEKLCKKKIFEYTHLILNENNKDLCLDFINYGYKFLSSNFKFWRLKYIFDSNGFKDFCMRLIRINPFFYKIYISKKIQI